MKRRIVLLDSEVTTIISELNIAINSTSDYPHATYLSNIVKKLKNNPDSSSFYISKPNNPKPSEELSYAR